jgi:hypothetical protein
MEAKDFFRFQTTNKFECVSFVVFHDSFQENNKKVTRWILRFTLNFCSLVLLSIFFSYFCSKKLVSITEEFLNHQKCFFFIHLKGNKKNFQQLTFNSSSLLNPHLKVTQSRENQFSCNEFILIHVCKVKTEISGQTNGVD